MRKIHFILLLAFLLMGSFMATSGAFLVVNDPHNADVIVVLGGDTDGRPARGLELLSQGFAPRLMLDVPATAYVYHARELDLAGQWIQGLPQAQSISICPIRGMSTQAEAEEVSRCLKPFGARRVLLVTSDFHTARALSTFRHRVPNYDYSVAASFDVNEFGPHWWQQREWAKTNFYEWLRRAWWELVDRWQ